MGAWHPKRMMVVGVSAGVGKSTFAKQLGAMVGVPVYHLDSFFWKPGWVAATGDEFREAQKTIVSKDRWLIEGNYTETFDVRTANTDTIIYLELPLLVCLFRVLKRWWRNRGKTRPDLAAGCPDKLDWPFIKFILSSYHRRRKNMPAHIKGIQDDHPNKTVVLLKGKKQIEQYLHNFQVKQVM